MTRDEAEDYVWEVHQTYFVQHPKAQTYTCGALYALLEDILPSEDERQDLYAALGVETCVECRKAAGKTDDDCLWCEVRAIVFGNEDGTQ